MFKSEEIIEKYGVVAVTTEPDRDSLQAALDIESKQRIELRWTRPNPDGIGKVTQESVRARMQAMQVQEVEETYKAIQGSSIDMDEELTEMAKISAENGHARIKGRDSSGRVVDYSTRDHPFRLKEFYDPNIEEAAATFRRLAQRVRDFLS